MRRSSRKGSFCGLAESAVVCDCGAPATWLSIENISGARAITKRLPFSNASATFRRASASVRDRVVREMPMRSAHSSWYNPSKSIKRKASSSSACSSMVSKPRPRTPQGLKQRWIGSNPMQRARRLRSLMITLGLLFATYVHM